MAENEQAPTIVCAVGDFDDLTEAGQAHYAGIADGKPVIASRDGMGVAFSTACCGADLGHGQGPQASTMATFLDQGWVYSCSILNKSDGLISMGVFVCTRKMVVKCVPQQKIGIGTSTSAKKTATITKLEPKPKVKELEKMK